ncbi:fibronectin type III domain-containing protein [candidate division KSB1 bacterium]|nr:fibronectin type III domain-containing protein [candidate division KSB1 bacterium]
MIATFRAVKKVFPLKTSRVSTLLIKNCTLISLITCLSISTAFSSGSLIATWNPNVESDLAGYKVYCGTTSGDRTNWNSYDVGDTTQYIIGNLVIGQTYYVVVTAYDWAGNESDPSAEASAVASSRRTEATFSETTNGINITWDPVTNADSYEIYAESNPFFTPQTPLTTVTQTQYSDNTFAKTPGQGRYYIVKAKSGTNDLFTFETIGAFNIKLQTGKNLVSLPLIPADSSLSGVLGTQLTGSSFSSRSDKVHVWNGNGYTMAWLVEGTTSSYEGKWLRKTGDMESTIRLNPNTSFWIEVINPLPDSVVTVTGKVCNEENRTFTLNPGPNFIGSCFPVDVTLAESNLGQSGAITGGICGSTADKVMQWKGINQFNVAWLVSGSGTSWDGEWVNERGDALSSIAFKAGHGYIIMIKSDNPNKTWQFPNPN